MLNNSMLTAAVHEEWDIAKKLAMSVEYLMTVCLLGTETIDSVGLWISPTEGNKSNSSELVIYAAAFKVAAAFKIF